MRRVEDRPMDMALLLYLLKQAGDIGGRVKVQKTVFLVEVALANESLPILPHYKYFRYENGPFSKQLWDDYDTLADSGFVSEETFKPTRRGDFVIELVLPELSQLPLWRPILSIVDRQLEHCRSRTGVQLMAEVYDLELSPPGAPWLKARIEDIPRFTDLIEPSPGGPALPDWLLETLRNEFALSDEDLEAAVREAHRKESELASRLN